MKIKELFKDAAPDGSGLVWLDSLTSPVRISGLPWLASNGNFHRLDDRHMSEYSDGLKMLTTNTSGAQISFRTDSRRIGVKVDGIFNHRDLLPNMADNASMGIDIYVGAGREKRFCDVFCAQPGNTDHYEGVRDLVPDGEEEITLNLPLYSGINKLEIGLDPESSLDAPAPYKYCKPVLFYGSSITQGACASRPGLSYCNILGRMFDFEVVDLGFSGCARGEEIIARLIASVPLSAFVYDYDHNAQNAGYLEATHEAFFRIIREAQPDLPVIMVSKADGLYGREETVRRRDIIKRTYDAAIERGDRKVWFIDGTTIYGDDAENCTVDGCHPNDIGFRHMVEAIYPALKAALEDL